MRRRMVIGFLAPALFLYLGFVIFPAVQAFYLSLFQTSGFQDEPRWVGLSNYAALASDPVFWLSVRHMLIVLFIGGALVFSFSFLFTIFMSSGLWGKKLFRALILMPNIIAVVGISTFWSFIFMPRYGLLTNTLKALGLDSLAATAWTEPQNIFWAMLVGVVWLWVGFFTILLLAGADKIPAEMFDAARIEGASNRQIFRYITLPMIWDVIAISLVLWTIEAIRMMEFPYAFGGPNIDQNLYTPAIYLFIMGFGQRQPVYQLGYATAIGVAMFLFTVAAVVILRALTRRERLEF